MRRRPILITYFIKSNYPHRKDAKLKVVHKVFLMDNQSYLHRTEEIGVTTKKGGTITITSPHGIEVIRDHWREEKARAQQTTVFVASPVFGVEVATPRLEVLLVASVLGFGPKVPEGRVVQVVGIAWYEIIAQLDQDPEFLSRRPWREVEEIIAGGYEREGYRVTLTPASNDRGRDVIAERDDIGKIRIYDQVKRYAPGNPVPAADVRELLGVLDLNRNVSKGVLSTTSTFAPGVMNDTDIMRLVPYRLELREGPEVNRWLMELAKKK